MPISFTREEAIHLLKGLSQIDGVLMTLNKTPDCIFCVMEEISEIVEKKLRGDEKDGNTES